MADMGQARAVHFPELNAEQRGALREALGPQVALANPLDYHTYVWGDEAGLAATYGAMMRNRDIALGCVVLDFPRADRCDAPDWDKVVRAVAKVGRVAGRPMAILSSLAESLPEQRAEALMADGILPLCGMAEGLSAIEAAARVGQRRGAARPILLPEGGEGVAELVPEGLAKERLVAFGLTVPRGYRCMTADDAALAARNLGGKVALKAEGVAHKSGTGGLILGLAGEEQVRAAALTMGTQALLLEEMITDGEVELLIGVVRDAAHGFVLTIGSGGVLAEIWQDRSVRLLPVSRGDIETMLGELRIAPRLTGYRGSRAVNVSAICDAVLAIQDFVTDHVATLDEVEVNPLICSPDRAVAVDALLRMRRGP